MHTLQTSYIADISLVRLALVYVLAKVTYKTRSISNHNGENGPHHVEG